MKFFTKNGTCVATKAMQTKQNNAISKQEIAQLTQDTLNTIEQMSVEDILEKFYIRPVSAKAMMEYDVLPTLEELHSEINKGRTLSDCLYLYALIALKNKLESFICLGEVFYVFPSSNLLVFISNSRTIILNKITNDIALNEPENSEFAISFLEQAKDYLGAFKNLKILYRRAGYKDGE